MNINVLIDKFVYELFGMFIYISNFKKKKQ